VYEIPVGPVHAGLIEPGHFRFWIVGETILRMKARLWFVHRGIERLFEGRDVASGLEAERISGDSAVGHALAYCQAIEDARRIRVPPAAQVLRGALFELERIYIHVADVGALCSDVGFGLAHAWALSLREHLRQLNGQVTGHRLLRGGVVPEGARAWRLPTAAELVELADSNALVGDRFAGTAALDRSHARDLGLVGVAGRASGLDFDARLSHPFARPDGGFSPATRTDGDVLARHSVRVDEVRTSPALLADLVERAGALDAVAAGGHAQPTPSDGGRDRRSLRGLIVHRAELGDDGRLTRVKVVDPSFLNWPACPCPWPTRSFRTSRSRTRAPTCPTRETTSNVTRRNATCCMPRFGRPGRAPSNVRRRFRTSVPAQIAPIARARQRRGLPPRGAGAPMTTPIYQVKAEFFKTLGHPARMHILEVLRDGERPVSELIPEVGIEPSHLSRQLGVMRRANLIQARKVGSNVYCSVGDPMLFELLEVAKRVIRTSLAGNQELLEQM